jgi:3-deoxy-D-manno-octulosonic-acid transferase
LTATVYRRLTTACAPLIEAYLRRRLRKGKEDHLRFPERFGQAGRSRPAGPLVWFHAASVGESVSVLLLIDRMLAENEDLHVLMTTGTVTSAKLMGERLPDRAIHQYVPVDRPDAVQRFLDHWHPDLGIWVESEFWPNLIGESHDRGIPLVLINARMSEKSFRQWRMLPFVIRPMLSAFDLCVAQSAPDAGRLGTLGARDVVFMGNLKDAAPPLPADREKLDKLQKQIGGRPVWLAASTHPGEEAIVGRVHQGLTKRFPDLLTVIVPRHPERGRDIMTELRVAGLKIAVRSRTEPVIAGTDIYIADTLGELGLFYRLAPIAFVGNSLIPNGGHNPLEPARLDCAVLFGPHMFNFTDAVDALCAGDGAEVVADDRELQAAVERLLGDPALTERCAANAKQVAQAGHGVVDAVFDKLRPLLPTVER